MAVGISDLMERAAVEHKQLETKVAELEKSLPELKAENESLKEELKKFEIFRDLMENPSKWWSVTLKDVVVIQQLCARATVLFGKRGDSESDSKEMIRNIDRLVEACVRYCVSNGIRWNDMVTREKLVVQYRADNTIP